MGICRADARRAELDLRPRPRRARPGAGHRAAAGGLREARAGIRPRHHRAGDGRRPERAGRDQRLRADHPRPVDRVGGVPPRRRAGPLPGAPARRDRHRDGDGLPRGQQRGLPGRLRRRPARRTSGRTTRSSTGSTGSSDRLARQRYLVGDTITEADVRLFTTLVRFDAVYHGHFKCNRHKLTEMPVLWAYARDLFQTPGFGDTVDFDHIKRALLRRPAGHQPDAGRAQGAGPDRLGVAARPRVARRPALRRRHPARPGVAPPSGSRPTTTPPSSDPASEMITLTWS